MVDRDKVIQKAERIMCSTVDRDMIDSFCGDVISLLKEQKPLEPIKVKIDQAGPLYYRSYCKKCGHHVGNIFMNKVTDGHENYCSKCGHEVKWSDID